MPLSLCIVSGTVYTVGGIAAPGVTVYCHRVIKSGTLIESVTRLVATSDVNGAVSFNLPRAATAYLFAEAEGLDADEQNGTAFSIPDAASATLESLLPPTFPITQESFTFPALADTPDTYVGQALKFARVNAGETGLEFAVAGATVTAEEIQDALSAFFPDVAPFDWTYDDAADRVTLNILDATSGARGLMSTAYAAALDAVPAAITALQGADTTLQTNITAEASARAAADALKATLASANDFTVAGAAGTPAMKLSGAWLRTGAGAVAQVLIQESGASAFAASPSGNGLGINSAAGFTGYLINAQLNASSRFSVDSVGNVVATGGIQANSTTSFAWNSRSQITAPGDSQIRTTNNAATGFQALVLGPTAPSIIGTAPANGQVASILQASELLTIAAAATSTTTMLVPAGAIVLSVSVRTTVAIPTAATYTVKIGAQTFNTAVVGVAANSTDPGTAAGAFYNATAGGVIITPDLTPGANSGRVRVTVSYILITPPTS